VLSDWPQIVAELTCLAILSWHICNPRQFHAAIPEECEQAADGRVNAESLLDWLSEFASGLPRPGYGAAKSTYNETETHEASQTGVSLFLP